MTPPGGTNKAPINDTKEMEELWTVKIFRILLKKFNELQEHGRRQLNKIQKTMHEQNKFNKLKP